MASNLFKTLTKIDNGRKRCIQAMNNAGFDLEYNLSLDEVANAIENCVEKSVEINNPTGHWQRPSSWINTQAILENSEPKNIDGIDYYPVGIALFEKTVTSVLLTKQLAGSQNVYVVLSDGTEQMITADTTLTWNENTEDKYLIMYVQAKYTVSHGTSTCSPVVGGISTTNGYYYNYGLDNAIEILYHNFRLNQWTGLANSGNQIVSLVFDDTCIIDHLGETGIYRTLCYCPRLEHVYCGKVTYTNYGGNRSSTFMINNPVLREINFPNLSILGNNQLSQCMTGNTMWTSCNYPLLTNSQLYGTFNFDILELPCGNNSPSLILPYASVVRFGGVSTIPTLTINNNRVFEYGTGSTFDALTLNGPQSYTFNNNCSIKTFTSYTVKYLDASKVTFTDNTIVLNCPNLQTLFLGQNIDQSLNLRQCLNLTMDSLIDIVSNLAVVSNGRTISLPQIAEGYTEDMIKSITDKGWVIA